MDPLAQYHPYHAGKHMVSHPKLVQQLAAHALRNIPGAHHVVSKVTTGTSVSASDLHPAPYNNDGRIQMMLH